MPIDIGDEAIQHGMNLRSGVRIQIHGLEISPGTPLT